MLKNNFSSFSNYRNINKCRNDLFINKIRETELFNSMKNMKNNETPGNDRFNKRILRNFLG